MVKGVGVAAKYEIVMEGLSQMISTMEPGDRLPSEDQLSQQFSVSRMTVRRALQRLNDAKRIVGIRGSGTFVARPTVTKTMKIASFTESMRSAGMVARSVLLSAALELSDAESAARLGIEPGAPIYIIRRLRLGDDVPLCLERTLLFAAPFPGLLGYDLTGSLYELMQRKYSVAPARGDVRVAAVVPSAEEAGLLRVDQTVPCLRVENLAEATEKRFAEATVSLYRGDRYELFFPGPTLPQ